MDEERPIRKRMHEIGQDLSSLSIEEIVERIDVLRAEISRLEQAKIAKQSQKLAAESFFKKA